MESVKEIKRIEIVVIEQVEKPRIGWYFYGKAFGIFGKKAIREVIFLGEPKVSQEEIDRVGLYVENDVVYAKPYAMFHMVDGSTCKKDFDSISEMNAFTDSVKNSFDTWIKL